MKIGIIIIVLFTFFLKSTYCQNKQTLSSELLYSQLEASYKESNDSLTLHTFNFYRPDKLSIDSFSSKIYTLIAKTYIRLNLQKSAELYISEAIKMDVLTNNIVRKHKNLYKLSLLHYDQGSYQEAIKVAEIIVNETSTISDIAGEAINLMGVSYRKMGKLQKATKLFEDLLHKIDKSHGCYKMTLLNIGIVYENSHNYAEAIKVRYTLLNIGIEVADTIAIITAYNGLAGIYDEIGDYHKALNFIQIAKNYVNSDPKFENAYSVLNLSSIYINLDSLEKAEDLILPRLLDPNITKRDKIYMIIQKVKILNKRNCVEELNMYFKQVIPSLNDSIDPRGSLLLKILYINHLVQTKNIDEAVRLIKLSLNLSLMHCYDDLTIEIYELYNNNLPISIYYDIPKDTLLSVTKAMARMNAQLSKNAELLMTKYLEELAYKNKITSYYKSLNNSQNANNEKILIILMLIILLMITFTLWVLLKYVNIKKLNTIIENQQKDLSVYFASVGHEIKYPLSLVIEKIAKLKHDKENIQKIGIKLNEIVQITQRINDIYAVDSKNIKKVNFYLVEVIDDLIIEMKEDGYLNNIEISKNILANFQLKADIYLLRISLKNIIFNSIYFLKNVKDPKIEITSSEKNGFKIINISDNGVGIMSSLINDKLTEPGVSLRANSEKSTGLGLYLIKKIINLHHGHLIIHNQQTVGFSLSLYFPK